MSVHPADFEFTWMFALRFKYSIIKVLGAFSIQPADCLVVSFCMNVRFSEDPVYLY